MISWLRIRNTICRNRSLLCILLSAIELGGGGGGEVKQLMAVLNYELSRLASTLRTLCFRD